MSYCEPPREFERDFSSFAEWEDWSCERARFLDVRFREGLVAHVLAYGVREPISDRHIEGRDLVRGEDLREGLSARGIGSRHRAVLRTIEQMVYISDALRLRIYAPEALTPLALRLRGAFPKFLGSEFTTDPQLRAGMYPIQCEDLTALTLPSDTFDLVTTNEVLEHVPDIDAALRETARILKPGCWHVGTNPMLGQQASIVKARLENGSVVHLAEPEYHGDPFGGAGSLVFEQPGWDILERARAAGFSQARMRLVVSQHHGCVSADYGGILVLCCRK